MSIDALPVGTITLQSQIPFHDPTTGADQRDTVQGFADAIQGLLTAPGELVTQYSTPSASGFSVAVAPPAVGRSVWLLMVPAASYAAGSIVLPPPNQCADGQEILVTCSQAVTALTVSGNGSQVNGAPTSMAVNAFFRLRFDGYLSAWYRVG